MSMWGEVFESLQTMSLWQLLFAFVGCTGYALVQGRLVGPRGKWIALASTALAAFGFVVEAERWVDAFVLMAVGVAGLGLFAALVWLISRWLGIAAAAAASLRSGDSLLSVPSSDPDGAMGPGAAQAITAPRTAPSH